jgi:threonine dehydrogenase-like Zn-dependent dehydrogenase
LRKSLKIISSLPKSAVLQFIRAEKKGLLTMAMTSSQGRMKALVWVTPGNIDLQEEDKPVPQRDEVLIRVRAAGICGSEVEGFLGKSDKRVPPLIMGHEFAGDVEQSGAGEDDPLNGKRVVVEPYLTCES